jgi:UPF0716 family protein affecting phage T7 exclusion
MEENKVVVPETESTETKNDNKLTGGEKAILGGFCFAVGCIGWAVGNYLIVPAVNKIVTAVEEKKAEKPKTKKGKKKSKSGVDYDEDGDFKEVDEEDTED